MAITDLRAFTFYGDLLGISAAYRLSSELAYKKLNAFYNTVFSQFETLCRDRNGAIKVYMFSDSVLIWGQAVIAEVFERLQSVYLELSKKDLLLRGAIVQDALNREPRLEVENFRKFLPTNDTLARAVGLANTVKGARLLIESGLATACLKSQQEWLTVDGYIQHVDPVKAPLNSILRRICPSPSGNSYELLYFWESDEAQTHWVDGEISLGERLKEIAEFQDSHVGEHIRETLKLLKRSEIRQQRTKKAFMQSGYQ